MARIARVVVPGVPHHIVQRGVRKMDVFFCDADRAEYLKQLSEQGQRFGVQYIAWCLMANHVHLVAVPEEEKSLALGVGEAHRRYTRYVNFREGWRGYLFQGRFHSFPLGGSYLLAAVRYVLRSPVRAGLVERPWDYRWSSARWFVGERRDDPAGCTIGHACRHGRSPFLPTSGRRFAHRAQETHSHGPTAWERVFPHAT
jgi:putative transposase